MENLNLFTSVESSPKDSKNSSVGVNSETKKEGISLFDSLLKESSSKIIKEESSDNSANDNNSNQENKKENKAGLTEDSKQSLVSKVNKDSSNIETSSKTETSQVLNTKELNNLNKIVVDSKLDNNSKTQVNLNTQIKSNNNNVNTDISKNIMDDTKTNTTINTEKSIDLTNVKVQNNTDISKNIPNSSITVASQNVDSNKSGVKQIIDTSKTIKNEKLDSGITNSELKSQNGLNVGSQININQNNNIKNIDETNVVVNKAKQETVESNILKTQNLLEPLNAKDQVESSTKSLNETTNTVKNNENLSLMDKLVLEAKKSIETNTTLESSSSESKIPSSNVNEVKLETNVSLNQNVIGKNELNNNVVIETETKNTIKELSKQEEKEVLVKNFVSISKDETSLSNQLNVQSNLENTNTENKVDIKVENNSTSSLNSTIDNTNVYLTEENKVVKDININLNTQISKTDSIVNSNNTNASNSQIDIEIVDSITKPQINNTNKEISKQEEKEVLVKNFVSISKDEASLSNQLNVQSNLENTNTENKVDIKVENNSTSSLNSTIDNTNKQTNEVNGEVDTTAKLVNQVNDNSISNENIQQNQINQSLTSIQNIKEPLLEQKINSNKASNDNTFVSTNITQDSSENSPNTETQSKSGNLNGLEEKAIVKEEKVNVKASLLDDLIKKATTTIENKEAETKVATNLENVLNKEQTKKSEVVSNIFLGLQKNSINNQNIINTSTARAILNNATGIEDVKKASDILNLNSTETELKVENNQLLKDVDVSKLDRKINILDKVLINIQRIEENNIILGKVAESTRADMSSSSLQDLTNQVDDVNITVNQNLAANIQTRIIGARQHMSSMMSDLARSMYENYRPPITTFKINLNPATLGMISVVMKNERDNSISISMNMSNNATLEAMLDNQNSLRSALLKSFGNEESSFNLDFSSNSDSSNNQNDEFTSNFSGDTSDQLEQNIDSTNPGKEDNLTYL